MLDHQHEESAAPFGATPALLGLSASARGVLDADRTRLRPVHNRPPSPDGFEHHAVVDVVDNLVRGAGVEPALNAPEAFVLP